MIVLIGVGFIVAWRKPKGWLKRHRTSMLPGTLLGLGGIAVLFIVKQIGGEQHFATPHAKIGMATAVLLTLLLLLGLNFARLPAALRPSHRILGRLAMTGGAIALLSGIALLLG
jgi:hypothetical protein